MTTERQVRPRNAKVVPANEYETYVLATVMTELSGEYGKRCLEYGVEPYDFGFTPFERVAGNPVDAPEGFWDTHVNHAEIWRNNDYPQC